MLSPCSNVWSLRSSNKCFPAIPWTNQKWQRDYAFAAHVPILCLHVIRWSNSVSIFKKCIKPYVLIVLLLIAPTNSFLLFNVFVLYVIILLSFSVYFYWFMGFILWCIMYYQELCNKCLEKCYINKDWLLIVFYKVYWDYKELRRQLLFVKGKCKQYNVCWNDIWYEHIVNKSPGMDSIVNKPECLHKGREGHTTATEPI